ncbi:MAG TPA: DUF6307 family protein [Nakamurella sp.]
MSQTYQQRLATVESALAAEKFAPPKGTTLTDAAAHVLHALDHIPEVVR